MESQIYKDLDRLLGENEDKGDANRQQGSHHQSHSSMSSYSSYPAGTPAPAANGKLKLPIQTGEPREPQDEWSYARDLEESAQVANYLLRKRFYLTALELHQELLERNGGVPHNVEQLNNIFTDQEVLDSLLVQNEEEANKAAEHGEDAREQKIAFLEYRLRGLQSDYDSVSEQLSHTRKQLMEVKSGNHSETHGVSGEEPEDNFQSGSQKDSENKEETDHTMYPTHASETERKVLNALVRRYLLDIPYSMTAVTFEQESGGIEDSYADLPLEHGTVPSSDEKFSLLSLYRQRIQPIDELKKSAEKVESMSRELESTKQRLEETIQELDATASELNASEEKLEAANARVESLRNELNAVKPYTGEDADGGEHVPRADKDGNYSSVTAAQYLSTLKVSHEVDTSSVMETLSSALPVLSKSIASKQRRSLLPLFSAVIGTHTSADARRVLGQQMLHLIKRPSDDEQLEIIKCVESLLSSKSNVEPESELLPHILTMATHRSNERRILAGRLCGTVTPYLSERRIDSVLATLNLLCEDENPDVTAGVAIGATCVVTSLRRLYAENAWNTHESSHHSASGLTALRGPVRRQFAELEDLMWRFLIHGPSTTDETGTQQGDTTFGVDGHMQRCVKEALNKVEGQVNSASGHIDVNTEFRGAGRNLYYNLSMRDAWMVSVRFFLPNMLEWAWELGILWTALLPQFMDLVVDVETSIEHNDREENDSSQRSDSRESNSRRLSTSGPPSDSHSEDVSGSSYLGEMGISRSHQGSRKMSMEDVQKTEWLVTAFISTLPVLHKVVVEDSFALLDKNSNERLPITSEYLVENSESDQAIEVSDLRSLLEGGSKKELPQDEHSLRCGLFDAILDGRIVLLENGTRKQVEELDKKGALETICQHLYPLEKCRVEYAGLKWFLETLIPDIFYASFSAPTTTAAGKRIRFAYGSILRGVCLAFGNIVTLNVVYPTFLHAFDLKFPDFKRIGVERYPLTVYEHCQKWNLSEKTLMGYLSSGLVSSLIRNGLDDEVGIQSSEDEEEAFSSDLETLHTYAWIKNIRQLKWLYTVDSESDSRKQSESATASFGAANAPFLLPLFGAGTLSVPSLPRPTVAYAIRELLQIVSQKKAGWNSTIHSPLIEQCVLSAGAFGGEEVMEHLLATLQRIGSNPNEFVRQCVAGMLSGILQHLDVYLLKNHGLTLVRQLIEDEHVSVARIAIRAITSLYSYKAAMEDRSIREDVNDMLQNTLKGGPTELVVETLRCLMRCVANAPRELREGFILDKLLEISNGLVKASQSESFKEHPEEGASDVPLWPGARLDDLEEVAMVCLEAYRAYTSLSGLLSNESKEMIADAVSKLLEDNELLDSSYRDMMQASLGSAISDMREGNDQATQETGANASSSEPGFAPVSTGDASHDEAEPEEFRQAAEAGNAFLAAMKGDIFDNKSESESAAGAGSGTPDSTPTSSKGRFGNFRQRLGRLRGKKAR